MARGRWRQESQDALHELAYSLPLPASSLDHRNEDLSIFSHQQTQMPESWKHPNEDTRKAKVQVRQAANHKGLQADLLKHPESLLRPL